MPQWMANGQRVATLVKGGKVAVGTVKVARGDYSDIEWDLEPGFVRLAWNDSVTKVASDYAPPPDQVATKIEGI